MSLIISAGPTILAGDSLSNAIDVSAGTLVQIYMPAAWTEADVTFQISDDGQTFRDFTFKDSAGEMPVFHDLDQALAYRKWGETEHSFPGMPNQDVALPDYWMRGVHFIKFRSGHNDAPVPQTATREFSIGLETP